MEMRPIVTGGAATSAESRLHPEGSAQALSGAKARAPRTFRERPNGVKVRRMARGAEDGFISMLVPGLKSSEDAERLVEELAFSTTRLTIMAAAPEGVWAQIAGVQAGEDGTTLDIEDRTSLAFETALHGERGLSDPVSAQATRAAYQGWVARAGSQHAAFTGEASWNPERRFERIFERLAFKGFARDARFELLVMLSRLGVYDLRASVLQLSGENEATWAAKRAFGIADRLLLDKRAKDFATACEAPLDALDLALHNWGAGERIGAGVDPQTPGDEHVLAAGRAALGL